MNRRPVTCTALGVLAAPILAVTAQAQTSGVPPAAESAGRMSGAMLGALGLIALVVVIVVGVKLFDLRRRRAEEAAALESRISDVLLMEPGLARLPIAANARRGFGRGSPAIIEVHGTVPSTDLKDLAMNLVRGEAAKNGGPFSIEDRLAVDPSVVEHAGELSAR
jgi:hypothetical protein